MPTLDSSPLAAAIRGTLVFSAVLLLLIFMPEGSLRYWQGWLFWLHFTAWTVGLTVYFLKEDPALVERRLQAGPMAEREPAQKRIQLFASITICAVFILSVLDHRFLWSTVPIAGVVAGHALVAIGYFIIFLVFRANSFAAATVGIAPGQKVVASGPYAVVRRSRAFRSRVAPGGDWPPSYCSPEALSHTCRMRKHFWGATFPATTPIAARFTTASFRGCGDNHAGGQSPRRPR